MKRFDKVIAEIDSINLKDPNRELHEGKPVSVSLLYGQRMSEMLETFVSNPGELLCIAARGQHIKRWSIPRNSYPMDRKGYLQWRTKLKIMHADLLSSIMVKNEYTSEEAQHVSDLIMKKGLKTDPESQTLEDVVCLVFLRYYFDDFIKKHSDEEGKVISIVRKTWGKMSPTGQNAALDMDLSERASQLVSRALN